MRSSNPAAKPDSAAGNLDAATLRKLEASGWCDERPIPATGRELWVACSDFMVMADGSVVRG